MINDHQTFVILGRYTALLCKKLNALCSWAFNR